MEAKLTKRIFSRAEVPVLGATLLMAIVFSLVNPSFLSAFNIFNVSRTASHYIFLALAQSMVVIVGGMNLSVGFIGSMTVVSLGISITAGVPLPVCVIIAMLVGITAGLINGLLIVGLKINSFVITLATSFVYQGLTIGVSKGMPYNKIPVAFSWLGRGNIGGALPYMLIEAVIVLAIMYIFFRYTVLGRRVLATGGNEVAARMSAVNTNRTQIIANVLSGFFASVAAISVVSKDGAANPGVGADWMIYSFAVAVIGGTSLKGGIISPFGLIISAYLLVFIKNGLVMINANAFFEQVYVGLILLIAVSFASVGSVISNVRRTRAYMRERRGKEY